MKNWTATLAVMSRVISVGFAVGLTFPVSAQSGPTQNQASLAAAEKEGCTTNLKLIYAAIQRYQEAHKDLPNWLSDLVPQYLADMNVLVCPVCRRTGETESLGLADPRLPSSYSFEFCPAPVRLGGTNALSWTRREWKRRQMGLVGSIVPLVRCRHHTPVLNLAFDGTIYESPANWETLVTNRVRTADLTPARIFADGPASAAPGPGKVAAPPRFPPRDPRAPRELLDLTDFYNAGLGEPWQGTKGDNLAGLAKGLQSLGGVKFDVRGVVQLGSQAPFAAKYAALVQGIPVKQKCHQLRFLHAAGAGGPEDEGARIGMYVVHFATNQMRLEIPIRYGYEVRNWHLTAGEPTPPKELKVAWRGENVFGNSVGRSVRLFLSTWVNVAPDVEIQSIDYVSAMAVPAPFLIAITVE